jgi:hypothetical protein
MFSAAAVLWTLSSRTALPNMRHETCAAMLPDSVVVAGPQIRVDAQVERQRRKCLAQRAGLIF